MSQHSHNTGYEKQNSYKNASANNTRSREEQKSDHASLTEQIVDATSNIGQSIRETVKEGAEKAEKFASVVSKQTTDVTDRIESGVKSNPFLAMGVAFAVGILCGSLTGTKLSK